jgi:peroxiredoxin
MANELTGDFDVVVEFAMPGANRLLAAMHRVERFPHSLSVRVDDGPRRPPDFETVDPSLVASVDEFGDPTANPVLIGGRREFTAARTHPALDSVVNGDLVGATAGPLVPSHLRGRAQLQLAPATLEVPDGSGTNITVRLAMMARYFPDPQTSRLAEFVRGELRITTSVSQVASQTANVIEVDLKGANLVVTFTPSSSSHPLSAEDLAAISLLVRNALKTSFLPSNNTLPSTVRHMQFRTLLGGQSALAVLLNMEGAAGNPGAFHNVFLGPGDAFAFAAGRDFILRAFNSVVGDLPGRELSFEFDIDWPWPIPNQHVVYTLSLDSASVDLEPGRIVLTVGGRARTGSFLPNFRFRARQALTLRLVGATAELQVDGDVSLEILTGGVAGWLVSRFKDRALPSVRAQRDRAVGQAQPTVRRSLDAEASLGAFLRSLLNPSGSPGQGVVLSPELAYTSFEIRPSGIVLHGTLAVPDWPLGHVEFEQILVAGHPAVFPAYEHTALRSWIPGGAIQRYEWRRQGQAQPFHIDDEKFVLLPQSPGLSSDTAVMGLIAPGAVVAYSGICLTVRGTRLSSSGPVVAQPVSASFCAYPEVAVLRRVEAGGAVPMVALTRPGARGLVEVTGHTAARLDDAGGGTPNLLVHFPDERTAGQLEFLMQALRDSGREDATTAVLAVLTADQLATTRYADGVIYAEDRGGAWSHALGVSTTRRPLTLIVAPRGDVVWRHEGPMDGETLAAALRRCLVRGGAARLRILKADLRVGRPAPNFLFEYAPGRALTLRKVAGRPAVLVFWNSASKPSVETVRDLQDTTRQARGPRPLVLAINDGEAPDVAKKVAAEYGLSVNVVTDPRRKISRACGVAVWPTTVFIDERGAVGEVRYGRFAGEHAESTAP